MAGTRRGHHKKGETVAPRRSLVRGWLDEAEVFDPIQTYAINLSSADADTIAASFVGGALRAMAAETNPSPEDLRQVRNLYVARGQRPPEDKEIEASAFSTDGANRMLRILMQAGARVLDHTPWAVEPVVAPPDKTAKIMASMTAKLHAAGCSPAQVATLFAVAASAAAREAARPLLAVGLAIDAATTALETLPVSDDRFWPGMADITDATRRWAHPGAMLALLGWLGWPGLSLAPKDDQDERHPAEPVCFLPAEQGRQAVMIFATNLSPSADPASGRADGEVLALLTSYAEQEGVDVIALHELMTTTERDGMTFTVGGHACLRGADGKWNLRLFPLWPGCHTPREIADALAAGDGFDAAHADPKGEVARRAAEAFAPLPGTLAGVNIDITTRA